MGSKHLIHGDFRGATIEATAAFTLAILMCARTGSGAVTLPTCPNHSANHLEPLTIKLVHHKKLVNGIQTVCSSSANLSAPARSTVMSHRGWILAMNVFGSGMTIRLAAEAGICLV